MTNEAQFVVFAAVCFGVVCLVAGLVCLADWWDARALERECERVRRAEVRRAAWEHARALEDPRMVEMLRRSAEEFTNGRRTA